MIDILLDNNNDILVQNGDFVSGESTSQEVQAIILGYPGWWKQYPLVGCRATDFLNSPNSDKLRRSVQVQLLSDGKQMTSYSYSNTNDSTVITVNGIEVDV